MLLQLTQIIITAGTQQRVDMDQDVIADYRDLILSGTELPPVTVYSNGAVNWLADGFHRYWAHEHASRESIECYVVTGELRDAIFHSITSNTEHGLRRSNADKRKAVTTLLRDEEWRDWSNRNIAKHCVVSDVFVGKLRSELYPEPNDSENNDLDNNLNVNSQSANVCTEIRKETIEDKKEEIQKTVGNSPLESAPEETEEEYIKTLEHDLKDTMKDNDALHKILQADDKLSAAAKEVIRVNKLYSDLEARFNGQVGEMNEMKAALRKCQNRNKKLEKAKPIGVSKNV